MQLLTLTQRITGSKNYGASISYLIDCNDDPFGQDVEHVLMYNILKYGDDPTVNQRDQELNHCLSFSLKITVHEPLNSKNYEASISQFIYWNDNPFGQDVEHVLVDNILKFGDDPTVNQRDQASTTSELWGSYLTVRWLEWRSVRSRCRACSNGQHTQKWWWSNGKPRRSKTIQMRERERARREKVHAVWNNMRSLESRGFLYASFRISLTIQHIF